MKRILSISYDLNLLNIRQMLLESNGYEVTSAEGYVQAFEKCGKGNFDLLVMGHSIPLADKESLVREAKRHCTAPVLSLKRTGESAPHGTAEEVDPSRPDLLLDAVKRLTTD